MKPVLKIYRNLPRFDSGQASAVTIGNFDGVHKGHQAILSHLCAESIKFGLLPTVMTFNPHPREFFADKFNNPCLMPKQINGLRDKISLLHKYGIRQIIIQRFNDALANMDAAEFIHDLLVKGLNTRWLLVGEDFRYGNKRSGDINLLRSMGQEYGFQVATIKDVIDKQNKRISSSSLRNALGSGDINCAVDLLGGPYYISGHVLHGLKLGRKLGFPTLNLRVPNNCALKKGIYIVQVHGLGDKILPAVASLGVRPTVSQDGVLLLETHILDQTVDAYGKLICIEFLEFVRDEQSFPDLTTLSAAINQDAQDARNYFTTHGL